MSMEYEIRSVNNGLMGKKGVCAYYRPIFYLKPQFHSQSNEFLRTSPEYSVPAVTSRRWIWTYMLGIEAIRSLTLIGNGYEIYEYLQTLWSCLRYEYD